MSTTGYSSWKARTAPSYRKILSRVRSCLENNACLIVYILPHIFCHLLGISVSFEPLDGSMAGPRSAQPPSQLWPKVAARVRGPSQCSLILAGEYAGLHLSVQGMQCYIHLRRLGRADLTLPEEVGPYLCKWQRERALIPWSQPSFIPRDTRALTVKPHLLFLPGSYPIHPIFHINYIYFVLFGGDDGPNILAFIFNAKPPLGLISS